MGQRQRDWARRTREKLFDQLGRACQWCKRQAGEPDEHGRPTVLTFDCIEPTSDGVRGHHKVEWSARMSFYRAQLAADNLQVLCDRCNTRKSDTVIRFAPDPELNWEHISPMTPF